MYEFIDTYEAEEEIKENYFNNPAFEKLNNEQIHFLEESHDVNTDNSLNTIQTNKFERFSKFLKCIFKQKMLLYTN